MAKLYITRSTQDTGMNAGAFALLDCLGFKGIWKEFPAQRVLAKLERVEAAVQRLHTDGPSAWFQPGALQTEFKFLSDTLVIAVYPTQQDYLPNIGKGWLVHTTAQLSAVVAREFLAGDVSRALRGCITYGQFLIRGNFIVGPAVDECANLERHAEGAFIWLSETAADLYDIFYEAGRAQLKGNTQWDPLPIYLAMVLFTQGREFANNFKNEFAGLTPEQRKPLIEELRILLGDAFGDLLLLHDYPMLTKGGIQPHHVVNPWFAYTGDDVSQLMVRYDHAMRGNKESIAVKRQETEKMLRAGLDLVQSVRDHWTAFEKEWRATHSSQWS